jgi:uncharacterized protein (DUF362 family)
MSSLLRRRAFIHAISSSTTTLSARSQFRNRVVKSHLTVIDATRILTNHGPQGGSLKDVKVLNKVIACRDIVAADAYATTFFGLNPQDITTTVTASKRGVGEMNLSKVKVIRA